MTAVWHVCGQALQRHVLRVGGGALTLMEDAQHRQVVDCPRCGQRLEAADLCPEPPAHDFAVVSGEDLLAAAMLAGPVRLNTRAGTHGQCSASIEWAPGAVVQAHDRCPWRALAAALDQAQRRLALAAA